MRFTVEYIKYKRTEYLSLVYTNDLGCKIYFIYKNRSILGGYWFNINTEGKVNKKLTPLLDDAMKKVAEVVA